MLWGIGGGRYQTGKGRKPDRTKSSALETPGHLHSSVLLAARNCRAWHDGQLPDGHQWSGHQWAPDWVLHGYWKGLMSTKGAKWN